MGSERSRAAQVLRRNLVLSIVGGIVLTAGLAVFTLARGSAQLLREELGRLADADARALAFSLAQPLESGDLQACAALVHGAAESNDILDLTLSDPEGRVLVSTDQSALTRSAPAVHASAVQHRRPVRFEEGSPEAGRDALLLVWPVFSASESAGDARLLGTLALRRSTALAGVRLRRTVTVSACVVLLGTGAIGAGLYLVLRRNALRPVELLVEGVERMAGGDLGARLAREDLGVLRNLGDALNAMWGGFASLAERIVGITARLGHVAEGLGAAMHDIESGSQGQEDAAEETAALLSRVNDGVRGVNRQIEALSRSTEEASSSTFELGASVEEVGRSVSSLNAAVESASSASQQMGASIRQVAESADEVQRMAEETAASMTQMDRAIQEVGDHVNRAREITEKVAHGAEEGSQAVTSTIQGIEEIRTVTGEARDVLERLVQRIGEIGDILTVIAEINDETNLLSLNAAIIAAQAGEQGKAFAVVASHVKTLAQRTAQSTQEIDRLITSVQGESRNAMNAMEVGIRAVETGVDRSRRAGEALTNIRGLASDAAARVSEITRAAQEQGRNSVHVADAANRTSAMVQKISLAMAEQSRASEQMLQTSETALAVCRQVQRSTEEQRQTTGFITESIASIGEMMRSIQENMAGQEHASESVAEAVQRVLEVARKTGGRVPEIVAIVESLRREAEALESELARFRLAAQAAPDGSAKAVHRPA